jgi:hypothetical protein
MRSYARTCLVILLVLFTMHLSLPPITFSQERQRVAQAGVTTGRPEMLGTPEKPIPTVKKEKKGSAWTWLIILGLAGGAAAAAGGGGGGDSGGGGGGGTTTTGDVEVAW